MAKETNPVYQINMTVLNDDEFLSPYSPVSSPVITTEVADFLENGTAKFLPKQTMQLSINSDCIDDVEKVTYDRAIRNYFALKLDGIRLDLQRNLIVSIIFTVIGIIGLAVMLLFDHFFDNAIWIEIVDIFAWVFVWEAVDQFFIERRKLIRAKRKYQAFTEMQINYCNIKQQPAAQ